MLKKGLLAAQLTGEGPPPSAVPRPQPLASRRPFDPSAFPCIAFADVLDGIAQDSEPQPTPHDEPTAFLAVDHYVGSAPTLPDNITDVVDYQLNPRRRRAGQEQDVSASLGTVPSGHLVSAASGNWQAVIGSLPKGLTEDERLKVRMSVPPSPSANLLKEMDPDLISSRTERGRKLRRKVLAGAVIVYVTAGYSGKRFIFEKAHELGIKSIVLDAPDSWVQLLEKEGKIAKFVPIDFMDADTVFTQCLEGIDKALKSINADLDGITTFCELAVPLASRLAEKLGQQHNSPASVDAARDKHATRAMLEKAGLPTPRHYRITQISDLPKAGSHVGFPAVIKPVSGAASIGVIRVNNQEELQAAYDRVMTDMRKARIVAGAIMEGDPEGDGAEGNAGEWIALTLMLEEYLDGMEVDVDLVMESRMPVYGAITDNWPTVEPYFNETGSNCPSVLPRTAQQELCEMAVRSVQALGLHMGVFHVELKYTSRGARLIEVNCRMGGGPVRDTNLLVWGVDLVEEHLMTAVGIPTRPPVASKPLKQMAEYSINAQVTGILEHNNYLDPWKNHPDVLYARPLVQPGHKCICVADGLPTWVCEIMVIKPTVHEAIKFIKDIEASLNIPIRPTPVR